MVSVAKGVSEAVCLMKVETTRPQEVVDCSRAAFESISRLSSCNSGYSFKGNINYQFLDCEVDAQQAIRSIFIKSTSCFRCFSVLDIGTGDGRFLNQLPEEIQGYGISAQDFRHHGSQTNQFYRIGNAEELTKVFPSRQFEIIVSHLAFRHFIDPLEALKQAYAALKPGGILLIDGFSLHGIDIEDWLKILQRNGYDAMATAWLNIKSGIVSNMGFFAIRKTKPVFDDTIVYAAQPIVENHMHIPRAAYRFIDHPSTPIQVDIPEEFAGHFKTCPSIAQFISSEKEKAYELSDPAIIAKLRSVINEEDHRLQRMKAVARAKLQEWGIFSVEQAPLTHSRVQCFRHALSHELARISPVAKLIAAGLAVIAAIALYRI
jgi:ubiquinone/menaquinone biosynthesis C-methylase UbiE